MVTQWPSKCNFYFSSLYVGELYMSHPFPLTKCTVMFALKITGLDGIVFPDVILQEKNGVGQWSTLFLCPVLTGQWMS